jgi:hypothetical protein
MSINIDELKKYLESKISTLKKELEYYEYVLSLVETCNYIGVKGNKGAVDVIKNKKGEIIADIYYTPPILKVSVKKKLYANKPFINALNRLLEEEKDLSSIDYEIVIEKDDLKEITVKNIKDEIVYNKIKKGIQTVLERISG